MVFGVCGKLGGGKSLTCTYLMLQHLRKGNRVTSNIRLKDDYLIKHRYNASNYTYIDDFADVNPWELPKGDLRGSGGSKRSIIVIDEAGEWLDSYGDARHKGQLSDVASWLRQSDKLGQDVFFIVQFENLLHVRLRSIVHRWLVCLDLGRLKIPVFRCGVPPPLNKFICVTEFDGRSKDYVGRLWIPKNKEIFDAYDTAAFFGLSFAQSKDSKEMDTTGKDYSQVKEDPVKISTLYKSLIIQGLILLCLLAILQFFV